MPALLLLLRFLFFSSVGSRTRRHLHRRLAGARHGFVPLPSFFSSSFISLSLALSLFLLLEKESLEKFWRRRRILFFHLVMSSTVHFQRFSFVTSQPMRIRILLYLKMKLQVNILSIRRKKEEKNDAASQQTCKSIETQCDTGIHDKNFLDFCREFRPPGSCGC